MNSTSLIFSQWIFIGLIALVFFLMRNHLFKKYEVISYILLVSAISTFSAGCFFLGKSSEKFSDKVAICPYENQSVWCFVGNYLSILPAIILIVAGLAFLFGVIENLEVRNKNDD
jgi:hypothetical protein